MAEKAKRDEKERIRVRALETCYVNNLRRREGDVFVLVPRKYPELDAKTGKPTGKTLVLTAAEQFSARSMELAPKGAPVRVTKSQEALDKQHDQILRDKLGLADPDAADDSDDDDAAQTGDVL